MTTNLQTVASVSDPIAYPPQLIEDIARIKQEHPNLGFCGFGDPDAVRPLQVAAALEFINNRCVPTSRRGSSSYHWKHEAEEEAGTYISNGAFIVAAIIAGCRVRQYEGNSPNAEIAIRRRPV